MSTYTQERIINLRGFPTKKKKAWVRFAERVFLKEKEVLTYADVKERLGDQEEKTLRPYLRALFEKLEPAETIGYTRNEKAGDVKIVVYNVRATGGVKVDWEKELQNAKSLFWFAPFVAEKINFTGIKEFWELLHAYANLPITITKHITETLRENFLEYAPVSIESLTYQTHEQLGYLHRTIEEVQAKGLLTAEPTAKLLEEAIES